MGRSIKGKTVRKLLVATKTSKNRIREGDLLFIDGEIVEVESAKTKGSTIFVTCSSGSEFKIEQSKAKSCLIARDEDMYSSTTLDLRFKEAMLMSQIEMMSWRIDSHLMQDSLNVAMVELNRVLYAVRFMLEKRGARRSSDE